MLAAPAHAEIKTQSETGFNIVHSAKIEAGADEIWKRLTMPKLWWSKSHSWSGSAEGFYLDMQANGCFCELFQEKQKNGKLKTVGSVEHMRVIFALPSKVLRMRGALGPLQSEAMTGTLTIAMEPLKGKTAGTQISFSYVVGGYMRYKTEKIAPVMDKVIAEQFAGLIKPFKKVGAIEEKADNWSLDLDSLTDDKPGADTDAPDKQEKNKSGAAKENAKPAFILEGEKEPR